MHRRAPLSIAATFMTLACAGPRLSRFEYAEPHMATEFRLVLYAPERATADVAARAAFERIAGLDRALSDYDPSSEVERLGALSDATAPTEPVEVSSDLERVLRASQALARDSGGAFDATVGPFVRLWRRARRQSELPDAAAIARAAPSTGYAKLELLDGARVRLLAPAMRLDFGGIAKGFALDEARAVLAEHGLERVLLVGGGDVLAGRAPPGRAGWRVELVGLEDVSPEARESVELADGALSTSGDLERFLELDGVRYSHILDPRTGRALTERRLVTVRAPSGTLADGLATALSVLEPRAGLTLAAQRGAEARILVRRDDRAEVFRTAGFPRPLSSSARRASP